MNPSSLRDVIPPMNKRWNALLFASLASASLSMTAPPLARAQAPNPATAPAAAIQPGANAAGAPAGSASAAFQPAIGPVSRAIADVRLDRWKLPKTLRDQTEGDLGSIRRDLEGTLPGLLATADAAAAPASAMLPVASNAGALYDVLLRVTERAKIAAPGAQVDELVQAQQALEGARRTYADQILHVTQAQEAHATEMQKVLIVRQTPPPNCPAAVAPATTPRTAGRKKKAAAKPTPQQ